MVNVYAADSPRLRIMSGTFYLPLAIAARLRLITIIGLGLLVLTTLAACTPEGEVDIQQVAGAVKVGNSGDELDRDGLQASRTSCSSTN